jgi:hypothetical protein
MQTGCRTAHAGSRLKPLIIQEGTAWKASLPAAPGKTRRTDDRADRGNVGIIRSPIRASILPDSHSSSHFCWEFDLVNSCHSDRALAW